MPCPVCPCPACAAVRTYTFVAPSTYPQPMWSAPSFTCACPLGTVCNNVACPRAITVAT